MRVFTVSILISSKSVNLFGVHCFAVLITPSSLRGLNFLFGICPTGHMLYVLDNHNILVSARLGPILLNNLLNSIVISFWTIYICPNTLFELGLLWTCQFANSSI